MRRGLVAQLYCLSSPNILLLGPSEGTSPGTAFLPASLLPCSPLASRGVLHAPLRVLQTHLPSLPFFWGGGNKKNPTTKPKQAQEVILPVTEKKRSKVSVSLGG